MLKRIKDNEKRCQKLEGDTQPKDVAKWTRYVWSRHIYDPLTWYPGSSQVGTATVWNCQKDLSFSSRTLQLQQVTSCDITSWCQAHSGPNRAVKEGLWNTSPSFNRALCDHKKHSLFWLLSSSLLKSILISFSKSIFMSYFVSFPLIHSKRLSAPTGSVTTAITWSLLNHMPSNLLAEPSHVPSEDVRFQRWIRQRAPHNIRLLSKGPLQ